MRKGIGAVMSTIATPASSGSPARAKLLPIKTAVKQIVNRKVLIEFEIRVTVNLQDQGNYQLLLCRRGLWTLIDRPQLPAAIKNLRQFRLQLNPTGSWRNLKCLIYFRAVNKSLNVATIADDIEPRPLAVWALNIFAAAKPFHVLPLRIAAIPID